MSKRNIILISIGVLIVIIIVLIFGLRSGLDARYENQEYGFSFSYPNGWKAEEKDVFEFKHVTFSDNGEVLLTVMMPYNLVESEVHSVARTEVINTNDEQTTLMFREFLPLQEGWERMASIEWQTGCNHNDGFTCFKSYADGGALVMNLGEDLRDANDRMSLFKDIITSFRIDK